MTKTKKNIYSYVENTIDGFRRTLQNAKECGWDYMSLVRLLDSDLDFVHGALMFVSIYEQKISEEEMNELVKKMMDAKYEVMNEFLFAK